MIGAGLAAGVGVLLLLLIWRHGWPRDNNSFRQLKNILAFSYFIGMIPVAALLMILRRRFERMSRPARMTAAATILVFTCLMMLWIAVEG